MELILASGGTQSEFISDDFAIRHFSNIPVPFRNHWRKAGSWSTQGGSDALKIIPYIFRYEATGHEPPLEMVDAIVKDFLLSHFPDADQNHIVIQVGDNHNTIPALKKFIVFQESVTIDNTIAMPIHFYAETVDVTPISQCKNKLFFQGAHTNPLRATLCQRLRREPQCVISSNDQFYYKLPNQAALGRTYRNGLQNSKYILCPKGMGQNSIRFYETLANGRVPVLVSDHVQLPLSHEIPWDKIVIQVPERDIDNIMSYLGLSDAELESRSQLAMSIHRKYFTSDKLKEFMVASIGARSHKPKTLTQAGRDRKHSALIITNACNMRCGGCHQLCGHWDKAWFISEADFRSSIESLISHYKLRPTTRHHINVYGGEPSLHPNWDKFLEIMWSYSDIPFIVFTNGKNYKTYPQNGYPQFMDLFKNFAGHDKNIAFRLDNKGTYFAPTLIAPCDVIDSKADFWAIARNNCYMWHNCEMTIYKNKAYICAPGAALDHMYNEGRNGWAVEAGHPPFEKSDEEIAEQAKNLCHRCRFCLGSGVELPKQKIKGDTLVSITNFPSVERKAHLELVQITPASKKQSITHL